ncbi:hypothetical protein [Pseudomonas jinjuensis]|uniref:Uncharacterized protein n=1 Tax=Pseudomonas jinjuensis TaxID=198616 RepID=A0A1H0NXF9_9PSED|nr:hypothetical protein [Pseudomonas jinjuensis]SDO97115.1 hypothetical protein SAMN05216193_11914 [Pseudomonas jinjuensis]
MVDTLLQQLASVPAGAFAAIAAVAAATGAIVAALITALLGKLIVSSRDLQDREAEWRKHALELTKLDLERKLKSGRDFQANPLRPCILDFLANYRDLQELGRKSPKDLYQTIIATRLAKTPAAPPKPPAAPPSVAVEDSG